MTAQHMTSLGIVIIGRNEGARLQRCLASTTGFGGRVVYVDSGSTDESVTLAKVSGAQVVELDLSTPFTAARARNAGMEALGLLSGGEVKTGSNRPDFIQFVDGDCEIQPGWLEGGVRFLQEHPEVGVVSGRLRERHPEASVYNALCDAEWNSPVGENEICGGIAMMRSAALAQTTLFDARMIAGEEPELCLRLRAKGWKIWRIADEMALHDAAMMRFGQFWTRMRRGGFAFGLWSDMYGFKPVWPGATALRRTLIWAGLIPLVIVLAMLVFGLWGLGLALLYPVQIARFLRRQDEGTDWRVAMLNTIGKFAELQGFIEFYWRKMLGRPAGLIEHK